MIFLMRIHTSSLFKNTLMNDSMVVIRVWMQNWTLMDYFDGEIDLCTLEQKYNKVVHGGWWGGRHKRRRNKNIKHKNKMYKQGVHRQRIHKKGIHKRSKYEVKKNHGVWMVISWRRLNLLNVKPISFNWVLTKSFWIRGRIFLRGGELMRMK